MRQQGEEITDLIALAKEAIAQEYGERGWAFSTVKSQGPSQKLPAKAKGAVAAAPPITVAAPPVRAAARPAVLEAPVEEVLAPRSSPQGPFFQRFELQPVQAAEPARTPFPQVIIATTSAEEAASPFIQSVCHGVSSRLTWMRAISLQELTADGRWASALSCGSIRLVLLTTARLSLSPALEALWTRHPDGHALLGQAEVHLLAPLSAYTKNASLKTHLWKAIKRYVDSSC